MARFDGPQGFGPAYEGMTKKQVLKAAKKAGVEKSVRKELKQVMKSDTDGVVSNGVEAEMLNSIMDSEKKMPIAHRNYPRPDRLDEGGSREIRDGVWMSDSPDGTFVNTTYGSDGKPIVSSLMYNDEATGKFYQLRDSDGDGRPDAYIETEPDDGRVFGKEKRHIDFEN